MRGKGASVTPRAPRGRVEPRTVHGNARPCAAASPACRSPRSGRLAARRHERARPARRRAPAATAALPPAPRRALRPLPPPPLRLGAAAALLAGSPRRVLSSAARASFFQHTPPRATARDKTGAPLI